MSDKMREEFEGSPRFRGMDFTRSVTHPEYYESPYANGAWDGWQALRESLVIELPPEWAPVSERDDGANEMREHCVSSIEAAGLKVK